MTDHHPADALRRARTLLAEISDDALEAVAQLSDARNAVDEALDEQMARATLAGHSVRAVADRAGLAPNSIAPRLARTPSLRSYAQDNRVSAVGIERARYDTEQGRPAPAAPRRNP